MKGHRILDMKNTIFITKIVKCNVFVNNIIQLFKNFLCKALDIFI